jgi:hypothetical protein
LNGHADLLLPFFFVTAQPILAKVSFPAKSWMQTMVLLEICIKARQNLRKGKQLRFLGLPNRFQPACNW